MNDQPAEKAADDAKAPRDDASASASASEPIPPSIDIQGATVSRPDDPVQRDGVTITGLQRQGVVLAKWVLSIIVAALIVLTAAVTSAERRPDGVVAEVHRQVLQLHDRTRDLKPEQPEFATARKDLESLARQIVDAKAAERAFWMQYAQMILLNLLLPVLTAILGYVFGANSGKR